MCVNVIFVTVFISFLHDKRLFTKIIVVVFTREYIELETFETKISSGDDAWGVCHEIRNFK